MPKTFRLREKLTRSYDTLVVGDIKGRDEDVLHRKHAGENDVADFDGLEPEEDFRVPLQRRQQREPLDLVKQRQSAERQPLFTPGQSRGSVEFSGEVSGAALVVMSVGQTAGKQSKY